MYAGSELFRFVCEWHAVDDSLEIDGFLRIVTLDFERCGHFSSSPFPLPLSARFLDCCDLERWRSPYSQFVILSRYVSPYI